MSNLWHVKNWFRVGRNISWKLNFNTLFGYLYFFKPFQNDFFYNQAEKKHAFILSSLEKDFTHIINKYKNKPEVTENKTEKVIWTLWWQGLDNAPPLVKACINTMKKYQKVIVITEENYKDYVNVPEYILEKQKKGYMKMAHLSDVIRFLLLEKYGGLWLDSTIFLGGQIPERAFTDKFFTLHTHYEKNAYVQHNLYHIFVFGSVKGEKLISFISEMLQEYWRVKDTIIDYLMLDYIVMVAYRNFPDIKNAIDNLEYTGDEIYELVHTLNSPYDDIQFQQIKEECIFSKLDWHRKYRESVHGKETYYSYIIKSVN